MPAVLVIEDDFFIRQLLSLHLKNAGYSVRLSADPVEGIRSVIENRPDAILLDVTMPYMSGMEVLRALKNDDHSRNIPVIMLTGRTDDSTWQAADEAGADAFLTKPVQRDELLATLHRFLPAEDKT